MMSLFFAEIKISEKKAIISYHPEGINVSFTFTDDNTIEFTHNFKNTTYSIVLTPCGISQPVSAAYQNNSTTKFIVKLIGKIEFLMVSVFGIN